MALYDFTDHMIQAAFANYPSGSCCISLSNPECGMSAHYSVSGNVFSEV